MRRARSGSVPFKQTDILNTQQKAGKSPRPVTSQHLQYYISIQSPPSRICKIIQDTQFAQYSKLFESCDGETFLGFDRVDLMNIMEGIDPKIVKKFIRMIQCLQAGKPITKFLKKTEEQIEHEKKQKSNKKIEENNPKYLPLVWKRIFLDNGFPEKILNDPEIVKILKKIINNDYQHEKHSVRQDSSPVNTFALQIIRNLELPHFEPIDIHNFNTEDNQETNAVQTKNITTRTSFRKKDTYEKFLEEWLD